MKKYLSSKNDWKVSASFNEDPSKFEVIGNIADVAELDAYKKAHAMIRPFKNVNDWIMEKI
jgi:hypothetical protein